MDISLAKKRTFCFAILWTIFFALDTANTGNHWVEIQVWGRATVAYVGNYLEWYSNGTTGSPRTMAKYYYAGEQREAMRHSSGTGTDGLVYLLSDHLGSTSRTVDPLAAANDNKPNVLTQLRCKPWGETRYYTGEAGTDFRFTGQRREASLGGTDGLYFYGARWYDPYITQFTQPDTDVMKQITNKYKLKIDGRWNTAPLPGHSGKHTDQYHQWVYDQLVEIDALAKGNIDEFLRLFDERIKDPVLKNPSLPYRK